MSLDADDECEAPVSLAELLEGRYDGIREWLLATAPECRAEQLHIRGGTQERAYWHYGYMMALRDVLSLVPKPSTPRH